MQNLSSEYKSQSWLSWFYRGILVLSFLVLFSRLAELQVIKGSYYKSLSEGNRIRRITITAPRGRIISRTGEILVGNNEVKKAVTFSTVDGYEKSINISGADERSIITEYERYYELKEDLGHVTGYLGRVGEGDAGKSSPDCLEKGHYPRDYLIGKTGLEKQYECLLRGVDGEQLIEVDSSGKIIRVLGRKEPIAGQDIRINIDYELQRKVVESFQKKEKESELDRIGAIIITDPEGEILAFHSAPSFDPQVFVDPSGSLEIAEILNSPDKPLFNRVIGGSYHPGSVFKPFVSLAALESGVADENYRYVDTGQLVLDTLYGTYTYRNWYYTQYGGVEGEIGLQRAIARSTDTFFYKLGEEVGMKRLNEWMDKFGLGKLAGIDLPGEITGLVASPEWKERVKGERWFLGNTYHFSIGQGDTALTPLQINTATAAIINGELCKPFFYGEENCLDLGISDRSLDLVRNGMIDVCTSGGTAFPFFGTETKVACKTGTAETGTNETTHAWFTFFWPAEEPELVGTILVEKGGEGSAAAAPIARDIYDWWEEGNK